jgi:predicted O-methyltransferase YrrM
MNLQQAKTLRAYVRRGLRPHKITEGGTSPEEMVYLANIIALTDIRWVVEIGFNTGYSAHAMLSERPDVNVLSFDIGRHDYIRAAKCLTHAMYGKRHKLILGNSLKTVPEFAEEYPYIKFDMAFIDGGHSYATASGDLLNVKKLLKPDSLVVMDDTTPHRKYGVGPYKAWMDAIETGFVEHEEFYEDGEFVESPTQAGTHVWAVGFYQ